MSGDTSRIDPVRVHAAKKRLEGGPTPPQIKYIEGLLIDCGFTTRVQRNAWLSRITKTEIRFIDDLAKSEASRVIDLLKAQKEHPDHVHKPVILHRTGGRDANLFNTCGCGAQIERETTEDDWEVCG